MESVIKINRVYFILFSFFFYCNVYAQTDWVKWEAGQISYELPTVNGHLYGIDNSNIGMTFLSLLGNVYYFFISDLDGDNCPFSPSCSQFFLQSVKETSIFKGTLMFADRFTRDLNFFKTRDSFKIDNNGKLIDPASNYSLHSQKIKL